MTDNDALLTTHCIDLCFNAGWEDDPYWKVVCGCGWEAWNGREEAAVRERHTEHVMDEERRV